MTTSKLVTLCKVIVFMLFITASCQASAGYYIEYMHDPCIDYNACNRPSAYHHTRHHYSHYRHHANHYARHYRHSSASIAVYYYWDMYPSYQCGGNCGVPRCTSCCHNNNGCNSRAYNEYRESQPIHYRDNQYHSSYYNQSSDVDYDTSTADDMN
jgi:hypothetical protein